MIDKRKNRYLLINFDTLIHRLPKRSRSAHSVYIMLCAAVDHGHRPGFFAHITPEQIASRIKRSPRTVKRALAALEKNGVIQWIRATDSTECEILMLDRDELRAESWESAAGVQGARNG